MNRPMKLLPLTALLFAGASMAQTFPTKVVRIINAQGPGVLEVVSRGYAQELQKVWGQPVIVENRAGASGTIGAVLMRNMLDAGFRGRLYAVNPKRAKVSGIDCFASVADLPAGVELAVIATPAPTAPDLIEQCGRAGIKAAVKPEDIVGRHTVLVANLAPRKMKFGLSEGMVLAASDSDGNTPGLYILSPDSGAQAGMRVK